jgi:tetraacyldisaccharide 4'-kinase
MKAPTFWYKQPGLTANLLAPLSLLWRLGGTVRRVMASPYRGQKPIICIGNIVAGGAGKTPAALAIAHALQQNGQVPVFVTLGYGGRLSGPLQVDPGLHTARDVGDEALLLACTAPVFIGRDRVAAIRQAEKHGSHIILDDGLQNPNVRPDIAFLVIDGGTALGNGYLIPAGPLRETLKEAMKRITAIILIGENIEQKLAGRARCPILRASWQPNLPDDFPRTQKFFAFAGIANPAKFYATCKTAGLTLTGTEDFPDHHFFTGREIARLRKKAKEQNARLLTTEKDWVRLPDDIRTQVTAFPVKLTFEEENVIKRLLNLPK